MNSKYSEAKKIVEKYGQQHLLNFYDKLTEVKKEKLLDQILSIDFEQVKKLYDNIQNHTEKKDNIIEPIEYLDKSKIDIKEKNYLDDIGKEIIKEGKLAAVTMAGGQGTRLGFNGPKGTYDIGLSSKKSLFELLCDSLKEANQKYNVTIPWYIMTSEENNADTENFFKSKNYFGYPKENIIFFKQGKFPMIDTNGKILLNEEGLIKQVLDLQEDKQGVFMSVPLQVTKTSGILPSFLCDNSKYLLGYFYNKDKNKGRIEIEYYSASELERIVELIESIK